MSLLGKATILTVQPRDLAFYWPYAIPFIQSALRHTDHELTLDGIRTELDRQERQLWMVKDQGSYIAAIITMIYTTQSGVKIGDITLAGGRDQHKWDHFPDIVGQLFKEQGCNFLDIPGRPGWARRYKQRGFRVAYTVCRKEL